jgi:hypothetical protein
MPSASDNTFGTVVGIANVSATGPPVAVLSPDRDTTATKVTFKPTGAAAGFNIYLWVNGSPAWGCHVFDASGCSFTHSIDLPANSTLAIESSFADTAGGDILVTVDLQ